MRMSPSQKPGMAKATSVKSRMRWSVIRFRSSAEAIASGSASTTAISVA